MKNGIVIYRSKYGAAKKYAGWIAKKTGFICLDASKIKIETLAPYNTIVFCGGIYASGIAGLSFLRKNYSSLREKKLAIFCVGASPYDPSAFDEIKIHNLKDDLKTVPLFYGRGAWDESTMNFKDRTLCRLLKKAVAKMEVSAQAPWMKALLCASGKKCDWTDEKYLTELIQYVQE